MAAWPSSNRQYHYYTQWSPAVQLMIKPTVSLCSIHDPSTGCWQGGIVAVNVAREEGHRMADADGSDSHLPAHILMRMPQSIQAFHVLDLWPLPSLTIADCSLPLLRQSTGRRLGKISPGLHSLMTLLANRQWPVRLIMVLFINRGYDERSLLC